MSTFIPPTPAATKSAEQHEEPSAFNHLLFKALRLTSEQVPDLNGLMKHRGNPNVHEIIAQNFCKPHALEDDLQFIREGKQCYIQSNVMISLSLMITYIKHLRYSAKITEVWILQGIYPLKDEWVFGCSLKTRLADQTKTQQLKWLWSKDSMNSTINQRLVEQTQEMNFKLEGSGGSTLDDTLRKQYLSSSDE